MDAQAATTLHALIVRLARADHAALAELYDAAAPAVHGVALRVLGDSAAADEVTGDVFLQAWRQADRYDPVRGTPLAWLLTMARSRAIDLVRARRSRAGAEQAAGEAVAEIAPAADEHAEVAERRRLVVTALAALQPSERTALELVYFQGLSHSDIAMRLGDPVGTVKTRIRRGMARLRDLLDPMRTELT